MKPDKKLKWATTVNKTLLMLIERVDKLDGLLHVIEVKMRLQPETAVDLVKRVERLEKLMANPLMSISYNDGKKVKQVVWEYAGKVVGKKRRG